MTCKDCAHYEICRIAYRNGDDRILKNSPCKHFKNKADFVEVVRCKDCNLSIKQREIKGEPTTYFCTFHDIDFGTYGFCSFGEKKEG